MVKTTKGGVAPKKPEVGKETHTEKLTAEDKQVRHVDDIDDETWERIVSMARSQSISPAECVKRAITQVYGSPQTTTAFNAS